MGRPKLSDEIRELRFKANWDKAQTILQNRIDAKTIKLARAYFAVIKKQKFAKALKKTAKIPNATKREKFRLARTAQYAGHSLTEEFPVFDRFTRPYDLIPFFEEFADIGLLNKFRIKAEANVNVPKILMTDSPCIDDSLSIHGNKELLDKVKRRPKDKSRFALIKV